MSFSRKIYAQLSFSLKIFLQIIFFYWFKTLISELKKKTQTQNLITIPTFKLVFTKFV